MISDKIQENSIEKIIPENAKYFFCTVESIPENLNFEFVAIDCFSNHNAFKNKLAGVGLAWKVGLDFSLKFIENLSKQKLVKQASLSSMRLPRGNTGGATMKGFRVFVKIKRG